MDGKDRKYHVYDRTDAPKQTDWMFIAEITSALECVKERVARVCGDGEYAIMDPYDRWTPHLIEVRNHEVLKCKTTSLKPDCLQSP